MATAKITLDEGTTTNTATYTITEDAVTKHIPRSVLSNNAGADTGVAALPLQVSLANTAANATAVKVDGSAVTQPVSGSLTTVSTVTNLSQLGGAAVAMNTGVRSAGTQRVTIATDDLVPISAASLPLPSTAATSTKQSDGSQKAQIVDGAGNVIGATTNALDINIKSGNPTTIAATQSGTWTVQPGNTANTTAWLTKTLPVSVSSQTALTTTATVSGSAGTYHGGTFINLNSVPSYIQVFDTTGAVTLGTTVPTFVQPIPANATAANGAGFVEHIVGGITITNGIKVAATTTATGASTSATALTGFITYR